MSNAIICRGVLLLIISCTTTILGHGVPQTFRTNKGLGMTMREGVREYFESHEEAPPAHSYHDHDSSSDYGRSYEGSAKSLELDDTGHIDSSYYDDFIQDRFLPLTIPPPSTEPQTTSRLPHHRSKTTINRSTISVARDENGTLKIVYPTAKPTPIYHYFNKDQVSFSPALTEKKREQNEIQGGTSEREGRPVVRGKRESSSDFIVFPDDSQVNTGRTPIPRQIKGCKSGQTICEDKDDLPSADFLESVLKSQAHKFDGLFGVDEASVNISTRIDDSEVKLCQTKITISYPTKALNSDSRWLLVIQTPNFTQGIFTETCLDEGRQCHEAIIVPNGYTTQCVQKYYRRPLVAMDENGSITKDLFKVPTCCQCIMNSSKGFS